MSEQEIGLNFFNEGAFLRSEDGQIHLWEGPFIESKPDFDWAWMEFFSDQLTGFKSAKKLKSVSAVHYLQKLEWLKSQLQPDSHRRIELTDFTLSEFLEFKFSVEEILDQIAKAKIDKAVPIAFSKCPRTPSTLDKINWMIKLLQQGSQLSVFGAWTKNQGLMAATPEILFRRQGGKLISMALAGTLPKSELNSRPSLLEDPKELHEHSLVVQDIQTQLSRWGQVTTIGPKLLELPSLFHLQTMLQVEDPHQSAAKELVQGLHPTPALGVSPRACGLDILKLQKGQNQRKFFGAPVMFSLNQPIKQELCLVAIRQIQWDQMGCKVGAGCGIVRGSVVEREWQEVQHKMRSVFLSLGII